jgi:hypothetical protein
MSDIIDLLDTDNAPMDPNEERVFNMIVEPTDSSSIAALLDKTKPILVATALFVALNLSLTNRTIQKTLDVGDNAPSLLGVKAGMFALLLFVAMNTHLL